MRARSMRATSTDHAAAIIDRLPVAVFPAIVPA
jgi:hypothetical protein